MTLLKPTQSIDSHGGSNSSSQYVKPFSVDERALAPSQRHVIDKLIRQLSGLTGQSTNEIWQLLREHLGLSAKMSLTLHHFSAAEFFLQQKIQYAQQGGSQNLLDRIMSQLSQGNNKEKTMAFMRSTFGHTALSLLNENELKQVLAQLPKVSSPKDHITPQAQTNGSVSSSSNTGFGSLPMTKTQVNFINDLIDKLAHLIQQPPSKLTQQLNQILNNPLGAPWVNQHFKIASEFLQLRLLIASETLMPLNHLLTLLKPLSSLEQNFIVRFSEQMFNVSPTGMLTPQQADNLVVELYSRRATGKNAWQVDSLFPVFSGIIPDIKAVIDKPIFVPALFATVLFIIFILFIFSA